MIKTYLEDFIAAMVVILMPILLLFIGAAFGLN